MSAARELPEVADYERARDFVRTLPRTGSLIIAGDKRRAAFLRDLIVAVHGVDTAASTSVVVATTEEEEYRALAARDPYRPAIFDPTLLGARPTLALSLVYEPWTNRIRTVADAVGPVDRQVPRYEPAIITDRDPATLSPSPAIAPRPSVGGVCAKCGWSGLASACKGAVCPKRDAEMTARGQTVVVPSAPEPTRGPSPWAKPEVTAATGEMRPGNEATIRIRRHHVSGLYHLTAPGSDVAPEVAARFRSQAEALAALPEFAARLCWELAR